MAWLIQQGLPQAELPKFDGSALKWVDFITKFRDLVHNQDYLNDTQRHLYLTQQLIGQAERAVKGFASDSRGYVLSLQRLKFYFGQKSKIAQATLKIVTENAAVDNDDIVSLQEFYYQISDCLVTLRMLRYESDLRSTQTLRQAVARLPSRMMQKWAEHSLRIRSRSEEPDLIHFADWLQGRILALTDPSLPEVTKPKKGGGANVRINATLITKSASCQICEEKHSFWKCPSFKALSPPERYEFMRKLKVCTNCCGEGHNFKNCPSQGTCFVQGCKERHHTTLHDYFLAKKSNANKDKKNQKVPKVENDKKDKRDEKDQKDRKVEKEKERDDQDTAHVNKEEEKKSDPKAPKNLSTNHIASEQDTYLWIVPVTLTASNGQSADTFALLDNASTDTMLRDELATSLNLSGPKDSVNLGTVLDPAKESVEGETVSVTVSANNGNNAINIKEAFVVPSNRFNMPAQPHPLDPSQSDLYSQLNGIELCEVRPEDVSILIGADVPTAHLQLDAKRGNSDEILAVCTMFGWTLFGKAPLKKSGTRSARINHVRMTTVQASPPVEGSDKKIDVSLLPNFWDDRKPRRTISANYLRCSCDQSLHNALERFWQQENSAILPAREPAMSREDSKALAKLETETTFAEGRYTVPMLRKSSTLPDGEFMARKRWRFLRKRFRRDPDLYEKYEA